MNILHDYAELKAHNSYGETIRLLAAKYYYSVSYMRKLVTKARGDAKA